MRVFYSWQSDSPNNTNRSFIRKALDQAIQLLNAEVGVSEADRKTTTLDHDTKGVMGAPPIAQTILAKIAEADVIVCDVSLVADGSANKKHINSNVAIELGYALGKKGYHALLNIMNTASGSAGELPFDLRDRRHPIPYRLEANATEEQRASELEKLVGNLQKILKEYLNSGPRSAETRQRHKRMTHAWTRGHYWNKGEPLIDNENHKLFCDFERILYFRAIPTFEQPELTSKAAYEAIESLPTLIGTSTGRLRNEWGALSLGAWLGDEIILSGCQVMDNREIWAFDADSANPGILRKNLRMENRNLDFLPSEKIRENHHVGIRGIMEVVTLLGYADSYTIEYGVTKANRLHVAVKEEDAFGGHPGPIYKDDVVIEMACSNNTSPDEICDRFIRNLFEEAGCDAPEYCLTKSIVM